MTGPRRVVIVGASLAGLTAVETCRELGYDGELTLVGMENEYPYDRPPLSKDALAGRCDIRHVSLRDQGHYEQLRVNMRLGTGAVGLEPDNGVLVLQHGDKLPFDGLIVATGTSPRTLAGSDALEGVYTLRTLADCQNLRAAFSGDPRLVIVGAGFIGAEVASTARTLGLDVTVLETQGVPLSAVLGEEIGQRCGQLLLDNGVKLRCGVSVAGFTGTGRIGGVRLADGSMVPADVVVAAIGVVPNVSWLHGSGLTLSDGVACDQYCFTGVPGVFAAGDVASVYNPLYERNLRVEHWSNAREQGRVAAHNLLKSRNEWVSVDSVPYFWSNQNGAKIQCVGYVGGADHMRIVRNEPDRGRLNAVYSCHGCLVGAVTFNNSRDLAMYRKKVASRATLESI